MIDRVRQKIIRDAVSSRLYVVLLCLLVSGLLAVNSYAADRHHPFRIGVLTESWGPQPQVVQLRQALQALGYRENEDFVIGVRFTQGDLTALPSAARDLVQYGVDLLFVTSPSAAQAVQQATTTVPIVFAGVGDPIGQGLIQSFARPGGNITGVSTLNLSLSSKRLQVFYELVPSLQRVLFLYDASDPYAVTEATAYREAAHRLGIELVAKAVKTEVEAQAALAQVREQGINGILAPAQVSLNIWGLIGEATSRSALPSMFSVSFMTEEGALASYGPNQYETGRQAARLVDKIIKGAHPAEIPVEVNTKIEFVINMKAATALRLTIAPEVLYQADRLIR
jgi:putative ABC transport system substrate-binding protein